MIAPAPGIDWAALLAGPKPVDPYLAWADATGYAGGGNGGASDPLPFLLEIEPGTPTDKMLGGALAAMQVPACYRLPAVPGAWQPRFITAQLPRADLPALLAHPGVLRWQLAMARCGDQPLSRLAAPEQPAAVLPAPAPREPAPSYAGTPVVIGVIDDGCPFAHPNLCDAAGRTRVRHLWDAGAGRFGGPWAAVPELGRGAELPGTEIDRYRQGRSESAVYPALGIDRLTGRDRPHGVGISHLCAGRQAPVARNERQPRSDTAGALPVLFVQLPLRTVADTTGGSIAAQVLDALHYIHARAHQLADRAPGSADAPRIVVNLSYGSMGGPHDGSSLAERALIDFLQGHPTLQLVLAAGNANRQPVHCVLTLDAHGHAELDWMLGPDHPLDNFLELWWPGSADLSAVRVELWAPGASAATLAAGPGTQAFDAPANAHCGLVFAHRVAQGLNGTMTLVAVRATGAFGSATAGHWRIRLVNTGVQPIAGVQAWVERNDIVLGRRRRTQARLMQAPPPSPLPPRQAAVLSSLATVDNAAAFGNARALRYLVAGSSRLSDGQRSDNSSTGPARNGRLGPDGLAPGELGPAQPGLLVPGVFAGRTTRIGGSSAAAALVTRVLARGDFPPNGMPPALATPGAQMSLQLQPVITAEGWFRIEAP